MTIPKYVTLKKEVGQTPLQCVEHWRAKHPEYTNLPLAYAGRLDPMASGKLLILIGDECKVQERYHGLDKQYEFSVLFGVGSDTGDVLGRLLIAKTPPQILKIAVQTATKSIPRTITLPYPHFSSKTVQGKPLHTWTLENRLGEITIPVKTSSVYKLKLITTQTKKRSEIYAEVSTKIETIPTVTDERKSIGNDFRRSDVRLDWKKFSEFGKPTDEYSIATFTCIASSGTYMRSLAEEIGKRLGTKALAYHIHRTHIGTYIPLPIINGIWKNKY